jgi:hypothetical protein
MLTLTLALPRAPTPGPIKEVGHFEDERPAAAGHESLRWSGLLALSGSRTIHVDFHAPFLAHGFAPTRVQSLLKGNPT